MTTLREKLARIVRDAVAGAVTDARPHQGTWQDYLHEAADILAAMHEHLAEPSDAMLAALAHEKRLLGDRLTIGGAWRAMLEAGLQP